MSAASEDPVPPLRPEEPHLSNPTSNDASTSTPPSSATDGPSTSSATTQTRPLLGNNVPPVPTSGAVRFSLLTTMRPSQTPNPIRVGVAVNNPAEPVQPQAAANNNNNGELPQQTQNLFHMRDRLFLALFFRVSLIYARAFPRSLRRLLEFCLLMQSILLLIMLAYIHIVYTRTPITCLNAYRETWPRDGILRVEIINDPPENYDIKKSYEKEEQARQRNSAQLNSLGDDILSMMLTADS